MIKIYFKVEGKSAQTRDFLLIWAYGKSGNPDPEPDPEPEPEK